MKISLPPYVIAPPDVLQVDAFHLVPKPPYLLAPFDEVVIRFPAIPENLPPPAELPKPGEKDEKREAGVATLLDLIRTARVLSGNFTIEPDGTINLGPVYGKVKVAGATVDEGQKLILERVKQLTNPKTVDAAGGVYFSLTQFRGVQQIRGEHLVRPDGTIGLGTYGKVDVAGLSLEEARIAIEAHLTQFLEKPEIAVDIAGYNSQVYYIIFDGAGFGEQVFRQPVTGNETVLDAIAQVNGLPVVASRRRIWVARPSADGEDLVLPVNWKHITRRGITDTNYQLLPGDRIYVAAEPVITFDTYLGRVFAPLERAMGGILLGSATYRSLRFLGAAGAGGP